VTALDPSLLNARHFQMLADCPDTWLVAESALDRGAAAPFDGRTFWLRIAKHHPWPWLNACGIEVGHIDVWGSVLTGAFQLACVAGCDPIIFVGADLAFTGGRPYCRGTTYEFDWAWSTSIGRSLEQAWQHHIDSTKPHASVDLHGRQTVSSGSLESFRDWIVSRANKSSRRVINATGDGILFGDGIEQGTLVDGLAGEIEIPSLATLASQKKRVEASDIAAQAGRVRRILDAGDLTASPLAEWIEFSGDGFDRAGIDAAGRAARNRYGLPCRSRTGTCCASRSAGKRVRLTLFPTHCCGRSSASATRSGRSVVLHFVVNLVCPRMPSSL
jgi:hypothetical protein